MVYYLQNVLSQILSKTRVGKRWGGGGGGGGNKMDYYMWRLFFN
jgi:hypothetical protein